MLEIKGIGVDKLKLRFIKMQNRAKEHAQVMSAIGAMGYKDVIKSFRLEKNEDGSKWLRFKDRKGNRVPVRQTIVKGKKRGGTKLLQDTGLLRSSIRWKSTKKWAKVFTNIKYAKYHEEGKGEMHRSFMWVDTKIRKKVGPMIRRYILNG